MSELTVDKILLRVQDAFANEPRPEHFTDYNHCCECFEHDEMLRTHTKESIGIEQLGNAGWDPICFINIEGFMYYFPALAALAMGEGMAYYLDQFVFHLNQERLEHLNQQQRLLVLDYLRFLQNFHAEELELDLTKFHLARLIEDLELLIAN